MKEPTNLRSISLDDAVRAGIAMHKQGKLEEAEIFYSGVLKEAPEHADALHFLGVMRHQEGRSSEGAELIERAIQAAPGDAGMRLNLGNVLRELGRREDSEAAYREAIRLEPEMANAYCNLGALLRIKEDIKGARTSLERAIEIEPHHGEAHCNLGNLLRDLGEFDEAIVHYQKSVDYQGHVAMRGKAAANLAGVLNRSGRKEHAIKVLKEWIMQDPDNATAKHMLAAISQEGVPDRAEDEYIRELFDGFARSFDDVLGNLHYRAPKLVGNMIEDLLPVKERTLATLDLGCGTGLSGETVAPYSKRLVGVDLSPLMLRKAADRGLYDQLEDAEITSFLDSTEQRFDLIVSVDAVCYFGDLSRLMKGVSRCLARGGMFCFSVEKVETSEGRKGFRLQDHGRYAHQKFYLESVADEAGLEIVRIEEGVLRMERAQAVNGFVVALRGKPGE